MKVANHQQECGGIRIAGPGTVDRVIRWGRIVRALLRQLRWVSMTNSPFAHFEKFGKYTAIMSRTIASFRKCKTFYVFPLSPQLEFNSQPNTDY